MKQLTSTLLILLLSGCQIDPYTHAPTWTGTDWYDAGIRDAISGYAVKDNEILADNYNDPEVDRTEYLKGYAEGNVKHANRILFTPGVWPGKPFPQAVIRSKMLTSYTTPGKKGQMKVMPL